MWTLTSESSGFGKGGTWPWQRGFVEADAEVDAAFAKVSAPNTGGNMCCAVLCYVDFIELAKPYTLGCGSFKLNSQPENHFARQTNERFWEVTSIVKEKKRKDVQIRQSTVMRRTVLKYVFSLLLSNPTISIPRLCFYWCHEALSISCCEVQV